MIYCYSEVFDKEIVIGSLTSFRFIEEKVAYLYVKGQEEDEITLENGIYICLTGKSEIEVLSTLILKGKTFIRIRKGIVNLKKFSFNDLNVGLLSPNIIELFPSFNIKEKDTLSEFFTTKTLDFVIVNPIKFKDKDLVGLYQKAQNIVSTLFETKDPVYLLFSYMLAVKKTSQRKLSLNYGKEASNLKPNDKLQDIKNFIFKGNYLPWENFESSYGNDASDKVNKLFHVFWPSCSQYGLIQDYDLFNKMLTLHSQQMRLVLENKKLKKINKKTKHNKLFVFSEWFKQRVKGFDNKVLLSYRFNDKVTIIHSVKYKKNEKTLKIVDFEKKEVKYKQLFRYRLKIKPYFINVFSFKYEDFFIGDEVEKKLKVRIGKRVFPIHMKHSVNIFNYNNIKNIFFKNNFNYYIRGDMRGRLVIQKRKSEDFDSKWMIYKIWLVKMGIDFKIIKRTSKVLFYEKNAANFEESSSKIFDRVSDYQNTLFVLKKTSPSYSNVKKKYGKKIIEPGTLRYIKEILNAEFFVGTELPIHTIGLRNPYKHFRNKLMNNTSKFIFLQHGITYSLSLKTIARAVFKAGSVYNPYKIIVNSELEATHWKEYGGYDSEDLWNTGLATFDGKKIDMNADKIVLLVTWRPWEENLEDMTDSSYYKALQRIARNIKKEPDLYKKLVIVAHPKIKLPKLDDEFSSKIYTGSIDKILNKAKVLITDYSSVCYDGFYRGSNVIFWWEELQLTLPQYPNKIMLNKDNVFGDVCVETSDIHKLVKKNYYSDQQEHYIAKYKKINQHVDDHNIDRIFYFLNKEGIIKK